jgi:N-acetylneuraminic acid mutarotase
VWLFDPVADTWTQLDINVNPAPRAYASLGVDAQSGHYLLFGGVGASNFGDTWELDPDARTWTARTGAGPSARAGATLAYDAERHVLLLHGGGVVQSGTVSDPIGDTWEYQPALAQWQQVSGAGSSPQIAQSVVYASAERQFVSFGGTRRSADVFGNFSTFNAAAGTWTSRLNTLLGRAGHVSGYDPGSDNVLISAGLTYGESGFFTEQLADVWGYRPTTNTVTQLGPQLVPGAIYRNLVFDSGRQTLVALGLQPADSRDLVWEIGAEGRWTHHDVAFAEGQTSYDFYHFGPHLYDSRRHLVYDLVEQQNTGVPALDLLAWDGAQWQLVCTTKTPFLGSANASAYDAVSDRILVFGGNLGGADWIGWPRYSASVYEVDPTTCSTVTRVATGVSPQPRAGASGAWDSRRSRLIIASGDGLYGYEASTWAWDPRGQSWTQLAKTGPHPPEPELWPRTLTAIYRGPTLAYDPVADKVLWLAANGDTWVLNITLDQWTQADVSAGAPHGAAATFDGQKGSLVALDEQGSLWDWDGAAWHRRPIAKASPGARSGAVAAWAHGQGFGVLFGGVSGDGRRTFLRDTWIWRDGWTLASYPSANGTPEAPYRSGLFVPAPVSRSPGARAGAAFGITSTTGDRRYYAGVLFGGEDETGPLGDTWKLDDNGWVQVIDRTRPLTQPTARTNAAIACLNTPYTTCVMFGGKDAAGTLPTDSWSCSGNFFWGRDWRASPSGRWGHAMAADIVGNRIYLFGGASADGTPLKDTWMWTRDNGWQKLNPRVSPPARFGHSMSFDSARGHIVMTGGTGQAPLAFDDTWELDPVANTWLQRAPQQTIGPRAGHVSFFDEAASRTILFGGLTYHADGKLVGSLGDTLVFDGADTTGDARLQLDLGVPCLVDAECNSGACVDGVCCNSPCGGQCSSCNLPGREGTCSPVLGNPVGGRPSCGGGDECAQCNGASLVSCGEADGTSCGLQGCIAGSFYTAGACSNRACTARSLSCSPFTCNATGCLSSCQKSADCYSSDYFCTGGRTCAPYAKLTSTSISPKTPQAFLPATLSVTSNVSAQFQYQVEYGNQTFYPCGSGWLYDTSCSWLVQGPGDAYWTVSTRGFGSDKVFDDRQIVVMHAVPYGQGGN